METKNLKQIGTADLVEEIASRPNVETAKLIDGMFTSVSISGPVEVLMVKPEAPVGDSGI